MKADLITKPIPAVQFQHLRNMLGVKVLRSTESSVSVSVVANAPRHAFSHKRWKLKWYGVAAPLERSLVQYPVTAIKS